MNLLRSIAPAALAAAFLLPSCTLAQEATQVPAGGIISLQGATLAIAREQLTISPEHVSADYIFRNDTPAEITSTMAFLVPNYTLDFQRDQLRRQGFNDAEFQVDGLVTGFSVEVRALLHGQDVTAPLKQAGIDIATFGHYADGSPDFRHLSHRQFKSLVAMGLYSLSTKTDANPSPKWTVSKRYVHDQTFSPGLPVRMQVSYSPTPGVIDSIMYQPHGSDDGTPRGTFNPDTVPEMQSVCTSAELQQTIQKWTTAPQHNAGLTYVDFFLTGNLAWKSPVENFTVEVDMPAAVEGVQIVPSFCWDGGAVEQTAPTTWTARAQNFVPSKDLRIGWFNLQTSAF